MLDSGDHNAYSVWPQGCRELNNQLDKDIADYTKVIELNPSEASTYIKRGVAYQLKRDYARQMYPDELDEDLITMIEDLIERRRRKRYGGKNSKMGS